MDKETHADADVPNVPKNQEIKKGPFDQLDRDELIKKCKGLLLIAKNAKQAKDECAEENAKQKDIIQKLEVQKLADKDNLRTMQEMVDSLTEKKLEGANRICDLEKSLSVVNVELSNVNEELKGLKEQAIENESLKRQIKRLTDENEELISEMESFEEKSKNDRLADVSKYENLKLENDELLIKFNNLSDHSDKISLELEKSNEIKKQLASELATVVEQNNVLTQHSRKQGDKLKLYKSKIIEFSGKLKQLKLSKEALAKIVAEYSQSVTKWQLDIVTAMQQIESKSSRQHVTRADDSNEINKGDEVDIVAIKENEERTISLENTKIQLTADMEQISKQLRDSDELLLEKSRIEEHLRAECTEKENIIVELQVDQNRLTADKQSLLIEIEKIQQGSKATQQSILSDFEIERSALIKNSEDLKRTLDLHKQELMVLTEKNVDVIGQFEKCNILLSEKQTEVNGLKVALDQLQLKRSQENDELLSEMREINEALKNRGDVISKQKQTISELHDKIDQLQQQIVHLNVLNDSAHKEIEQMNDRIKEMENRGIYADDSQISVSTVSKAEETSRMRDIEDSFEEKYNKLRLLAVKLKKKVTEQSSIIQALESKNNQNANEGLQITSKLGVMEVQVKNLQLLQSENDRLLDELEAARSDGKNNQLELERVRSELDKVTTELVELKDGELRSSDVKKVDSSQAIKEYVKQIQELKDANAEFVVLKKSMENELIKLKDEINSKDKDLSGLKELEKLQKVELAKIKTSLKQTNVLNLEMDAYEKSLKETTQKLETKNLQVAELKSTITSQEATIEALKTQIKMLEDNLDSEKQHSIDLKQQINIQQTKIKENHHDISELKIKNDALNKEKNSIMLDLDEFRLDSAKNISENEKMIRLLQSENEKNVRQICDLQDEIDQLKSKLMQTEQELVDVNADFSSYKVRAQSVLRKNQTMETSREKELDEELSTMQVTNESLNTKISTLIEQNRQISIDFEAIKQERDHLKGRCKELLQLLDESRQQIEEVQEQNRQESVEHQEALKSQRLQIDTLNGCYKKQISELEEKYLKEIEDLRLSNNRNRNDGESFALQSSVNVDNRSFSKPMLSDEQQIDWVLMERQAAEGSENTSSNHLAQRKISSNKSRRELIPLDELLNNTFDENAFISDRSVSPTIELESTKAKLSVQESSVKHLTSLLAEAEQDLARLTQLNDVLKEELRRQERSAAREQHLHNLEYLKNVVFKFLTINCGDEKSHLVPVLNTILKLSPEETHKLERVAKGGDSQRKWGSYLPGGWSSNQ